MDVVTDILAGLFGLLLVMFLSWVLVFGGAGALLARSRGASSARGWILGAVGGPLGWAGILWSTRTSRARIGSRPADPLDAAADPLDAAAELARPRGASQERNDAPASAPDNVPGGHRL